MSLVKVAAALVAAAFVTSPQAATLLDEGFDDVAGLAAAGWVFTNLSNPVGLSWFQGNSGVFEAAAGGPDSYAAANFNSTTATQGVIDNWLISPELLVGAGSTLTFSARGASPAVFELIEVRFSSGANSGVAGFSTVLTGIPPVVGSWAAYTVALPTAVSGRFAFRYSVADAINADYVGIDSVTVTPVPEPATMALFGVGLAVVGAAARRRALAA